MTFWSDGGCFRTSSFTNDNLMILSKQVVTHLFAFTCLVTTVQELRGDAKSDPFLNTGLVWDTRYQAHDPGENHPENAKRLQAIEKALRADGTWDTLVPIQPRLAEDTWILRAHTQTYLEIVKAADAKGLRVLPTGDTRISAESLTTARLAVGGVLEACDQVMSSQLGSAFCATRPPGHHATASRGMGFCIFNHVAIAVKYLQEKHGLERILMVDWDVHHGNGTYDILKRDPKVFQFHLQQRNIYPGTGKDDERGEAEAEGQTLNVNFPAGSGIESYLKAIDEQLVPAMETFRPQFILISAGFDAHEADPIGGLKLSSEDFGTLTRRLKAIADQHGEGRIVSVLEGGYNLDALAESVRIHIHALQE